MLSTCGSITSIMSLVKMGRPSTFVKLSQSTRNSARSSFTSWPMFISGTSTRSNERSTSPVFPGSGFRWRMCAVASLSPFSRRSRLAAPWIAP